jgi:hypothetical protein
VSSDKSEFRILPVWQSIANFGKIRTIIAGMQVGVALDSGDPLC